MSDCKKIIVYVEFHSFEGEHLLVVSLMKVLVDFERVAVLCLVDFGQVVVVVVHFVPFVDYVELVGLVVRHIVDAFVVGYFGHDYQVVVVVVDDFVELHQDDFVEQHQDDIDLQELHSGDIEELRLDVELDIDPKENYFFNIS